MQEFVAKDLPALLDLLYDVIVTDVEGRVIVEPSVIQSAFDLTAAERVSRPSRMASLISFFLKPYAPVAPSRWAVRPSYPNAAWQPRTS
jgi:hypothetical protein